VSPHEAFLDLLVAAMKDAALEKKLTQLALQFDPTEKAGRATHRVRVIVVPEELEHTWPSHAPLGSAGNG
jgi:hypothetical protein